MTDQTKTQKAEEQVETLELNRETIQDLTEEQAEQIQGGLYAPSSACLTCSKRCGTG